MGIGRDGNTPLLPELPETPYDQDEEIHRTGTLKTAIAHIITAVIGSGVLSLAWSTAQLGWIAGPLAMVFFAVVTMIQSSLLTDCYRSPDSELGHIRNRTYMDAVRLILGGKKNLWICGLFQQTTLIGCGIAYIITAATSMRIIYRTAPGVPNLSFLQIPSSIGGRGRDRLEEFLVYFKRGLKDSLSSTICYGWSWHPSQGKTSA